MDCEEARRLWPIGARVEWLRSGAIMGGVVRDVIEFHGWPKLCVRSNGFSYRLLPQDILPKREWTRRRSADWFAPEDVREDDRSNEPVDHFANEG